MLKEIDRARVVEILRLIKEDRETRAYVEEELKKLDPPPQSQPSINDRKYTLYYRFEHHPEGVTVDQLPAGVGYSSGVTDSVLVVSIMRTKDGGFSFADWSVDGATGEGIASDLYLKVWAYLTKVLMDDTDAETVAKAFQQLYRQYCAN